MRLWISPEYSEPEDDRRGAGEQPVKVCLRQAMRMLACGLQSHEVDDVDDADPQLRQVMAEDGDRG